MADVDACSTWTDWLDRHGPALLLLARRAGLGLADAEDVVQEAFVRFWKSRDRAKDQTAYLYACVRNAALDRKRADARRRGRETAVAGEENRTNESSLFESTIEQRERNAMIERELQNLPDEQREALVMKLWGGLTFAQIGEAVGVPMSTAASRYRYALAALREALPREQVL